MVQEAETLISISFDQSNVEVQYRSEGDTMTIDPMTTVPPISVPDNDLISSAPRKPSLLRNHLLKRTTHRTKRRLLPNPIVTAVETGVEVQTTPDSFSESTLEEAEDDDDHSFPNSEENLATTTTTSPNHDHGGSCSEDISEQDTECTRISNACDDDDDDDHQAKVASPVTEEDVVVKKEETLQDEGESKTEGEATPLEVSSKSTTGLSVSTTKNLSIVVTGTDIVVEYRNDKCTEEKENSPKDLGCIEKGYSGQKVANSIMATLLSPLGLSPTNSNPPVQVLPPSIQLPRRPKGIMKRPRDSNIAYHHPRRPLPPPMPPPGFKGTIASPRHGRKRVSFDEEELSQQFRMSQLRRQAKHKHQRSLAGMISMAMPILVPYMVAIAILVASSMVPLPNASTVPNIVHHESSPFLPPMTNDDEFPKQRPSTIIYDIASRTWDERKRMEKLESTLESTLLLEKRSAETTILSSNELHACPPSQTKEKTSNYFIRALNGLFRKAKKVGREPSSCETSGTHSL